MIKIWNWQTGDCLSTLRGHSDAVVSLHFDGQLLASGSADRTIKIFNFQTKVSYCLRGHTDWVNQVRIDTPSSTLLSASDDCTIKLWDLESRTEMRTFIGHVGHVQQVLPLPEDFEPDDLPDGAGSGGARDNTDTMSIASGRSATPLERTVPIASQEDDIRSLYPGFASNPSRPLPPRYMLTGGLDSTVRLWDTAKGKCLKTFFGHVEGVWGLAGDALRVVTSANDGMVKVWDPRSGTCERTVTGHRGPVTCVGLSDSRMASGGDDGEVRVYSFINDGGAGPAIEVGTPN
jgi:F-box/WD-40 domain protein MET30